MWSRRTLLALAPLGAGLLLAAAYCAEGRSEKADPKKVADALAAAEKLSAERDRLGGVLLAGLRDKTRPPEERAACALALSGLKYTPALPVLIELIDFEPATEPRPKPIFAEPPSPLETFPCMRALVEYGDLAVPAVVDAYLKENRKVPKLSLTCVLIRIKVAKLYVQGLLMEHQDRPTRVKLLELLVALENGN
jgi:hypothetical protein